MTISQNDWNNYIEKLSKLSRIAGQLLKSWVDKHGLDDVNALIEYAYAVITKYGEGSAEMACIMYDAVSMAQKANVEKAIPAATATIDDVAKAINGSLKQSPSGRLIEGVGQRLVKQAGSDTTVKNAIRDKAQLAWIPSGDTCAFCITLASRGWQNASKDLLKKGHAEHIHAHCDCQHAVRFNKNMNIKGYDPQKYLDMYNSYEGKPQDKINAMRRAQYAEKEESRKQLKNLNQKTLVNMNYINSNDYRKKLGELIDDIEERRSVEETIKDILSHRTGTNYEDLAYINSINGKAIINKSYDYYDKEKMLSKCIDNNPMKKMLKDAKEYTIIGVHNHPSDNAPSIADIFAARNKKYKYGIIPCHNGTIYKYYVSESFWDDFNAEIALADLQDSIYNGKYQEAKKAISDLLKLGIKIEVR